MKKTTTSKNTLSASEVFAFLHSVQSTDLGNYRKLPDNVKVITDAYGLTAGEIWSLAAGRVMVAYSMKFASNIFSPYFGRVKYFDSIESAEEFISDVACHTV